MKTNVDYELYILSSNGGLIALILSKSLKKEKSIKYTRRLKKHLQVETRVLYCHIADSKL